MCYKKWDGKLETGIIELDIQHRTLLDIVGMLHKVFEEGRGKTETKRILREFERFIIYHFKTEEDMFIKYNYPLSEREPHIREHRTRLMELQELRTNGECDENCLKGVLALANIMFDEHTAIIDKKFGDFLKNLD